MAVEIWAELFEGREDADVSKAKNKHNIEIQHVLRSFVVPQNQQNQRPPLPLPQQYLKLAEIEQLCLSLGAEVVVQK